MISIRDAAAQSGGVVHICIGNRDSELTDPVLRIMNKRDNKWLGVDGWTAQPVNIRAGQQFVRDGELVLVCGGPAISEVSEATPVLIEIPELAGLRGEALWPPVQPALTHVTVFGISSAEEIQTTGGQTEPEQSGAQTTGAGAGSLSTLTGTSGTGDPGTEDGDENEESDTTGGGGTTGGGDTIGGGGTTGDPGDDTDDDEDRTGPTGGTGGTAPPPTEAPKRSWLGLVAAFLLGIIIGAGGLYAAWDQLKLGSGTSATDAAFIAERDQLRDDLNAAEGRIAALESELRDKSAALATAVAERDAATQVLEQSEAEAHALRQKIIELNERIAALEADAPDADVIAELTRKLAEAEATVRADLQILRELLGDHRGHAALLRMFATRCGAAAAVF